MSDTPQFLQSQTKNPFKYLPIDHLTQSELDDDFIYLQPKHLIGEHKLQRKRKIYRISCNQSKTIIIRKVKAKAISGLNEDKVAMSYLNCAELGFKAKPEGDVEIYINSSRTFDRVRFYKDHPNDNVRYAFIGIVFTVIFGLIGALPTLCTFFHWVFEKF